LKGEGGVILMCKALSFTANLGDVGIVYGRLSLAK
jgi:hypothetical protein